MPRAARPPPAPPAPPGPPAAPALSLREAELWRRGDGLLQRWRRRRAELTPELLRLLPAGRGRPWELRFERVLRLDGVERRGGRLYFSIATARRDFDFRCHGDSAWDKAIALALMAFQNRRALQAQRRLPAPCARGPDGQHGALDH